MCVPVQRQDFEADFGLVQSSGFPCFRGSSGSGAHKAAVTGWSEQSEQCRQCKHEGSVAGGGAVVCDSCGSAGVSAATVSGESVVAVGVDREDRIVAMKVGCAQRVP